LEFVQNVQQFHSLIHIPVLGKIVICPQKAPGQSEPVALACSGGQLPTGSQGSNSHFRQQARVNAIKIAGDPFYAEALLDAPSSCIPHFHYGGSILSKPTQPGTEGAWVAGRN